MPASKPTPDNFEQDPGAASAEPLDPFDPAALRIDSDMDISTEKVLTAVPVRKPKRDEFFRVHPGEDYTLDALVIEREEDMDHAVYVVLPAFAGAVPDVARRVRLFVWISRRGGNVFLWPAKIPLEGSNSGNRYSETGLKIAEIAKTRWVRMYGDRNLGGYQVVKAKGNLDEPKWPDREFRDLLRMAFEGRVIDRLDHPVIRELNGDL